MAQVIGTYGDGAGKKKKKTAGTVTPAATPAAPAAPKVVTPTKPEKPASVNVPAQTYDEARREQRRDQRYRNGQAPVPAAPPVEKQQPDDPLDTGWLLSAKKQAEAAWEKWLWETDTPHRFTLEDFYRQIGIPVTDDPEYAGMIPSLSQLVRDAHRAANTRPSEEEETLYPGMTDEKFLRLWYQDAPEWDDGVRDGDAARAEQRAGKKYQETKESRQIAEDASVRSALEEKFAEKRWEAEENDRIADGLSTQAAIDEKLAMRKALDSNNSVTYNKYTGEYTINVDKLPDTGKWNVSTTDGKIVVDPEVENRIARTSRIMASLITTTTPNAIDDVLSPVLENLINSGLLRYKYGSQGYVLNNPNTKEVGVYATAVDGWGGLINIGVIADKYGNIGVTISPGVSYGVENISFGGYVSETNAPTIHKTGGPGFGAGGSVSVRGIGAGIEYNVLVDSDTGKIYTGQTASFGASAGNAVISAEAHASATWTWVYGINILNTLEELKEGTR